MSLVEHLLIYVTTDDEFTTNRISITGTWGRTVFNPWLHIDRCLRIFPYINWAFEILRVDLKLSKSNLAMGEIKMADPRWQNIGAPARVARKLTLVFLIRYIRIYNILD